ncbi:hypothetical protein NX059_001109 [Plenodomus lindquistii]|nr:hypothetical protein NX059_001109 [Plenodomus lindquistii]
MFGSPKSVLNLYKGGDASTKHALRYAHVDLPKKHLTGTALANMTDLYVSILSRSMNDKMFQFKFWTQIEDVWSFFQQVITRCMIEALFGSTIMKEHRTLLRDYWAYDEAVSGFMPGMSRPLMTAAYEAPRDKMLQAIESWLKNHHSGSEFARIGDEDPVWDENKGSKFIQERDDVFAKLEGIDTRARAADMLAIMHGLNSIVVPSSFWSLIEVLNEESLTKRLISEIAQHYSPKSMEHDVIGLARSPLVRAVQKETQRLHVANCLVMRLDNDCQLDDAWSAPKGSTVVAFSRDIALNAQVWTRANPRTVEKPLDQFWPERFSTFNKQTQRTNEKTKAGRPGVEALEHTLSALESDQNHILGEDLIQALQTATLAVFLAEFEMLLCEVEVFEGQELPSPPQLAFGRIGFHQKIAVRLRKRSIKM